MFIDLKKAVRANFDKLARTNKLFYVTINRDQIWDEYLAGFADPIIKQEHNCNCCKSFLRQYAGVVAIINNQRVSIWDGIKVEGFEQAVANIRKYINSLPITDIFLTFHKKCGTDKNLDTKNNCTWEHFYFEAPRAFVTPQQNIPTAKATARTDKEMLERAFNELTQDALETVLELIAQNSLYRGQEFKANLEAFVKQLKKFKKVPDAEKENYLWLQSVNLPNTVKRIRNTAIGTLLIDLSEGMDLEQAVSRYESVVAPTNYKRPTALVTPKMVEQAKETLSELGLLDSLERRFAQESDLSTKDIIYTDNSSILTDVFDEMAKDSKVDPKKLSKIQEISIEEFLNNVVPDAKSIELLLENKHVNKFCSLLTAQDSDAPSLLKWNNHFSWTYTGGITDSIKERVKAEGGSITGELRISLAWHNYDDLDLHVIEPCGNQIYFSSKRNSKTQGALDVDMNADKGESREPVENIVWPQAAYMGEGLYQVIVNNYCKRDSHDQGFTVQVECRGEQHEYTFDKNPKNKQDKKIVDIKYSREHGIISLSEAGNTSLRTLNKWGLSSNQFHKVRKIMLSPNHWGDKPVGNKHYMFFLENCVSDEEARAFFNEFLKPELDKHRKVFEILGSKLKVAHDDNQLSGLGFSSTQPADFFVRVTGKFQRTLKVKV